MQANDPSRQPDAVQAFLAGVPPFDRLPPFERAALAAASRVALYLEGEPVGTDGDVCCVQRGGVRLRRPVDSRERDDVRGEGECFGAVCALAPDGERETGGEGVALEDTFLVRLPGQAFAAVCRRHGFVADYFANALSPAARDGRMPGPAGCPDPADGDYLFTRLAGDVASRGLTAVPRGTDLRQAARVMEAGQVGSVLVREGAGAVIGIVTDRDLRRAVATGMALDAPVETLMSAPVASIDAATPCFEALLQMTGSGIRHLLVTRNGEPAGMVTASDVLLSHGRSPMALLRAARRAADVADLGEICRGMRPLAAALVARGATAAVVSGVLTLLAEQVLARLLQILEKRCGPSPAPCRWLLLGAAGRRELLPGSGLSLAVVPDDGGDPIVARAARTYMQAFLPLLGDALAALGLHAPSTRLVLGDPRTAFSPLGFDLDGDPLDHEASLEGFDARVLGGSSPDAGEGSGFPPGLAAAWLAAAASRPAPLGLYQGRLMERDGSACDVLDVLARGSRPLTALARLAALSCGVVQTGTTSRLDALGRLGVLPEATAARAVEAFAFFEAERLGLLLTGREVSGRDEAPVSPASVSPRRRHGFRAAFAALEALRLALAAYAAAGEGCHAPA